MAIGQRVVQYLILILLVVSVLNAVVLLTLTDRTLQELPPRNPIIGQVVGTVTFTVISCGDGSRQSNEECEGSDLNGSTCTSLGLGSGSLTCLSNCSLNTSDCSAAPPIGGGAGEGGGGDTGYREPEILLLPELPQLRKAFSFDVILRVSEDTQLVNPGDIVRSTALIIPREATGDGSSAAIYFTILDAENRIRAEGKRLIRVQLSAAELLELQLPSDALPGMYRFFARVTWHGESAEAFDEFDVIPTPVLEAIAREIPGPLLSPSTILTIFLLSLFLLILLHSQYTLLRQLAGAGNISEYDVLRQGYLKPKKRKR